MTNTVMSRMQTAQLTPLPIKEPLLLPWPLGFVNDAFFLHRDPRVLEWPLMNSVIPNFALLGGYLVMVLIGPKIMTHLKPFDLKWVLVVYNALMVAVSAYILYEVLDTALLSGYTLFCQPIDFSRNQLPLRMARAIWLYTSTRYVEFIDTLFFILRKKNRQITFLHVYHHVSIATVWWVTTNVAAGGMMSYMAAINCFIHVIMYTYYGLAALGPAVTKYLWWKTHLTKLQLLQFVIMLLMMSRNTRCQDPHFPQFLNYIGVLYGATILTLFLNFYIQTYFFKKGVPLKEKEVNGKTNVDCSGSFTMSNKDNDNDNHNRNKNSKQKAV